MTLTKDMLNQIADPTLTANERAQRRCQLAKQLEGIGKYGSASEVMGELWQGVGEWPALDGLDQRTAAEVLLRVGTLTGWIGSVKQIEGAQEKAKNLIDESIRVFEALPDKKKIAEAQTELAVCYWREGAFDKARVILQEALSHLDKTESEIKASALICSGVVEQSAKRFNEALRILKEATPIFERCSDDLLLAKFHNEFANVLNYLSSTEYREDYVDRALIEYTAASYHFGQVGHTRYQACVENNLGYLYGTIDRFPEAHDHLDRAQALFTTLKDRVHLAQVDETRAKVLLKQGRETEAERLARSATQVLKNGGEQSLYAEALTAHGMALARLGRMPEAQASLQRAVEVAEQAGDIESAGQAALTIIEECGLHLSGEELSATYERAADLLGDSQNPATLKRLCACARRMLFLTHISPSPPDWTGFSLKEAVRRYESHLIERALRDADGVVSRAAQWLGLKHHQSLVEMLKTRHRDLLHARSPIVPRKRSIIHPHHPSFPQRHHHTAPATRTRPFTILLVEDNQHLAMAVKETLSEEGWTVQTCADGLDALRRIMGDAHYDLFLLDNQLPGASGLDLLRHARALPHRRHTPIIMFSASDCEAVARRAGADAFLHKPQDIARLVETVARLLAEKPA